MSLKNLFKEQRVGIFVDVVNMYHSAKHLYKARVNFKEILNLAIRGRKLIRAIAYVIKAQTKEEAKFFEVLGKQGFEVKIKDLQIYPGGLKKGDWDVGLTVDAIKLADKLDVLILVTGDGDFIPLVFYLQENKGCRVEVIAFSQSASSRLKEAADEFIDLSKNPSKYLLKTKNL